MRPAASLIAFIACAGLLACAPGRSPKGPLEPVAGAGDGLPASRLLLVYVIHGDGDYVWHDASGHRRLADSDALAQALEVGSAAKAAEVFVFHQKPRRRLSLHPSEGGQAWHFRRGSLVSERPYSRRGAGADFLPEAELIRGQARLAPDPVRFFAYFGHEVPALGGLGYSRSLPRESFTLARLARGLDRITSVTQGPVPGPDSSLRAARAAGPYALIALSACRGGTPATTSALLSRADFLLASPTEIHLSSLDTRALIPLLSTEASPEGWDPDARRIRVETASLRMLRESFGGLAARTQAPVALALYEAGKAAAFLEAHPDAVRGEAAPGVRMLPMAWRDCGEDPDFGPGGSKAGATVLYRPGRLGAQKSKAGHSGWECPQGLDAAWSGVEAISSGGLSEEVTPEIPEVPSASPADAPDPVPPS